MNKKVWILVALLAVFSLVAAQCGGAPATEAPAGATEEAAPAATEDAAPVAEGDETAPEGEAAPAKDMIKVAFVYVAPIGDLGWTWAHDQGRLALEEEFGDKVETAFVENVPEGPEAERVIRDFAQKGFDLIITTSFGYMDPTITVAEEFPETTFVHISGYKTAPNVSTVFGRMYQPRYLSGVAAGAATESNIIGYVAAFPIPEVIRGINAFTLGVKDANPDAEVRVVWTNTWFGPQEEKEAAEALLAEGADVITQHQDTTEPQKAAADAGAVSIGYDSDMAQFVGDTVLTSPVWNWGPKYINIAHKVMDGTYASESYWGGLADGVVDLAAFSGQVPEDIQSSIAGKKELIATGQWDVFCGPITGANGKVVVPEGNCLTDAEMLSMDFFVDGVAGEAPSEAPEGLGQASNMAGGADAAAPAGGVDKVKAAFVYVAPIGDLGWTWAHDQGRLMLEEELGDQIETAYIENVPEGPEAERVIRDFAQKGYNLIVTTSFGYMDPTITVAEEFPEVTFVHISGYKTAPNVSTVFGRMYQPRYLSGLVAGASTESNIIGFVAAFPIPEVIRGINAFTLGVKEANPNAEVRVVWTNTWFGPQEEKEAAEALLAEGADVITQHQDTTEPQKAAADAGAVSIGYDSDMAQFVGDTVLTSPVWNWGPKYIDIAKQVMSGSYASESYWGSMGDGVVALAPISDKVPDDVKGLVEERAKSIRSGQWDVFCGPITGANGKVVVPEGSCLTDGEMLGMDYFVDGVKGDVPGEAPEGIGQPSDKAAGTAGAAAEEEGEKYSVAFVYVGPVGDLGWTYAHDQGRLAAEEAFPWLETSYSELVPEGPDAERVIRDYAEKGYDMVIATSFGYMDSMLAVAGEYPDQLFEHTTGYKMADNMSIHDGRGYEAWYLAGIVAGNMTESNKLGYVAPYPIPEVVRNMNAFALGARSVNPDVELTPVWIFTWVDPVKEREAAQALVDAGVDVVARESDTPEPDKVAEENGVYAVGYNAIAPDVAPNAILTAPIWDWGVYYTDTIQNGRDGTWVPHAYWGHMSDGIIDLAPFGTMVPQEVQDEVMAAKAQVISGELIPFTGPIKNNKGEMVVEEGQVMTDEELLSFDWLVEGVVGEIPQ